MSRIGDRIRIIRTGKGITQKQLAKTIGVNESYIAEVESGKKVLNDDLLKRLSKALEQDMSDVMMYKPDEEVKIVKAVKTPKMSTDADIQEVWNHAFDSVLKAVPVYGYDLEKQNSSRQLPVVSNRIDGFPKEKVLYLQIQDNDMLGFRILKGDTAFGYFTQEIENNSICLIEYNSARVVRQLKKIDGNRLLLISNSGTVGTETINTKEVKVLVRLVRLEINL